MAPLFLLVVTTVGSRDEARTLARTLVERGLAACAQISAIESYYAWQGAVEHDAEFRVLFKVAAVAYDATEQAIRELHSYDLPAIHAIPIERAWGPYREWVEAQSRPAADFATAHGAAGGDAALFDAGSVAPHDAVPPAGGERAACRRGGTE